MTAKHATHEAKSLSPAEQAQAGTSASSPMNVPDAIPARALPKGFRYAAAACGLRRKNRLDLGVIIADKPATAAGVFTTESREGRAGHCSARITLRAAASRIRAIVVNSGNANCANGPVGMRASRATAKTSARDAAL